QSETPAPHSTPATYVQSTTRTTIGATSDHVPVFPLSRIKQHRGSERTGPMVPHQTVQRDGMLEQQSDIQDTPSVTPKAILEKIQEQLSRYDARMNINQSLSGQESQHPYQSITYDSSSVAGVRSPERINTSDMPNPARISSVTSLPASINVPQAQYTA